MRYKGEYAPSFLLDPGTQVFHSLTPTLDQYLQVHYGYTPFAEIEGMDAAAVKAEWEAQRKDDVVMAEPHEPRPRRKTAKESDDDSDESEDEGGPNDYPSPPPPGFGNPDALGAELDGLFVFVSQGDKSGVLPYAAFRSTLTPVGRRMTKELVAAVGADKFASSPMQLRTKALLHFG